MDGWSTIYVEVEDGMVQAIYGTEKPCSIIVCDRDNAKESDEYATEYCEKLDELIQNGTVHEIW